MKLPETIKSDTQPFTVTSGALRVTDPYYSVDTWCSGQIDNVKNGNWLARVGYYRDEYDIEMSKKSIQRDFDEENRSNERWFSDDPKLVEHYHQKNQKEYDKRIAELAAYKGRPAYIRIAYETNADELMSAFDEYELLAIDVGVDSGQAGFFDLAHYTEALSDETTKRSDRGPKFESFYDSVGDLTCGDDSFGTIAFGAVASSGYGDGSYSAYAKRNDDGELIGAIIVFIGECEDEDGDDEEN